MPTIALTIDGRTYRVKWNRSTMPTPADIEDIEADIRARQAVPANPTKYAPGAIGPNLPGQQIPPIAKAALGMRPKDRGYNYSPEVVRASEAMEARVATMPQKDRRGAVDRFGQDVAAPILARSAEWLEDAFAQSALAGPGAVAKEEIRGATSFLNPLRTGQAIAEGDPIATLATLLGVPGLAKGFQVTKGMVQKVMSKLGTSEKQAKELLVRVSKGQDIPVPGQKPGWATEQLSQKQPLSETGTPPVSGNETGAAKGSTATPKTPEPGSSLQTELRPELHEPVGNPSRPPGNRWTSDRGAMPGEPEMFLDGGPNNAKAAITEVEVPGRGAYWAVSDNRGRSLGQFSSLEDAAAAAERQFPLQPSPTAGPSTPKRPVGVNSPQQRVQDAIREAESGDRGAARRRVTPDDPMMRELDVWHSVSGGAFVTPLMRPRDAYAQPWHTYVLEYVERGLVDADDAKRLFSAMSDKPGTRDAVDYTVFNSQIDDLASKYGKQVETPAAGPSTKEPSTPRSAQTGVPITLRLKHGTPDMRFAEEFEPTRKGYYKDAPELLPDNTQFESVHGPVRGGFKAGEDGVFFTDDDVVARSYADPNRAFDYQNAIPAVLERYVTLQNPKVIDWGGKPWKGTQQAIAAAKAEGHDGIIIKNVQDVYSNLQGAGRGYARPANNVVVFNESAISREMPSAPRQSVPSQPQRTADVPKPEPEIPQKGPKVENGGGKPEPSGLSRASRAALADVYGTNKPVSIKGKSLDDLYEQGSQKLDEGFDAEGEIADLAKAARPASDDQIGAFAAFRDRQIAELKKLNARLDKGDTSALADREALLERIAEFDRNLDEVKGSAGRSLKALQIGQTVNWADLDEVLVEAQRVKGSALTTAEIDSVKKIQDDLVAANKRAADAEEAARAAKATEGVGRMMQDAMKRRSGKRTVQVVQAEKGEVRDRIAKLFRETIGTGPQSGGLQALFETVPELAREIRKYIELTIEEFKIARLDEQFYKTIRTQLDELNLVDPETGKKIDITDSDIRATFAKHYEATSRTTSEATKTLNELRKQADLFEKIELAKAGDTLPSGAPVPKPSAEVAKLRKQLNDILKTVGASPADNAVRTRLEGILKEAEEMLSVGYRKVKGKAEPDAADVAALKQKIALARKEMRLEDRIATLESQLESGVFKGKSKRVEIENQRTLKLKEQAASAERRVRAAIKARQPQSAFKKAEGTGRSLQLLNHVARVVDLTANSVKMATYMATNPARSLLSELGFAKTIGREKLLTPARILRVTKGMPGRITQNVGDIWKGADLDTLEKHGRSGGIGTKLSGLTDLGFKDFYHRIALDDYALGYAKAKGLKGQAFKDYREAAWKQLTEGADGPLSVQEVQAAKLAAHDWSLRQTFNIENVASNTAKGMKAIPAQSLRKAGHPVAADAWEAIVDANTRFTQVITNVALEKVNYTSGLGLVESALRTMAGKSSGMAGKKGFRAKTMGLVKGQVASTEARLITDLAVKGATGLAVAAYGASEGASEFMRSLEEKGVFKFEIAQTKGGTRFIRWTFMPGLHGGIDAQQLGGVMSPLLMGQTKKRIDESDLTDKQKAELWRKYQLNELTSTPLASNAKATIEALQGDKDLGQYAGGVLARNLIPGGVREEAERLDEARTGTRLRKSTGFWDEFLKRIPGYRESLPSNEK